MVGPRYRGRRRERGMPVAGIYHASPESSAAPPPGARRSTTQRLPAWRGRPAGPGDQGWRSPIALALIGVLVVGFLLELLLSGSSSTKTVDYSDFLGKVRAGEVTKVDIAEGSTSSRITFKGKGADGKEKT